MAAGIWINLRIWPRLPQIGMRNISTKWRTRFSLATAAPQVASMLSRADEGESQNALNAGANACCFLCG
jgi:hypothetical protein